MSFLDRVVDEVKDKLKEGKEATEFDIAPDIKNFADWYYKRIVPVPEKNPLHPRGQAAQQLSAGLPHERHPLGPFHFTGNLDTSQVQDFRPHNDQQLARIYYDFVQALSDPNSNWVNNKRPASYNMNDWFKGTGLDRGPFEMGPFSPYEAPGGSTQNPKMVDRMYQQYLIESGQRAETAATADWNPEEVQAEIKAGYHAAMDERRRRQAAEEQAAKMKHLTSIAVQLQKHFARSNLNPAPQNIPY